MKQLLCLYILCFSLSAQATVEQPPRMILETGAETKKFVQKNIGRIQQEAAVKANVKQVYLDDEMICLSSHSYIPEVGACQLTGDLGEEGTESAFVVVVSEKKLGSGDWQVDVNVMRVSAGFPVDINK
jgi:hypothetical protein